MFNYRSSARSLCDMFCVGIVLASSLITLTISRSRESSDGNSRRCATIDNVVELIVSFGSYWNWNWNWELKLELEC